MFCHKLIPCRYSPRPAPRGVSPPAPARKASDEGCAYLPDAGQCGGPKEGQDHYQQQQHWVPGQAPQRKRHRGTPQVPFPGGSPAVAASAATGFPHTRVTSKPWHAGCQRPPAQPLPATGGFSARLPREWRVSVSEPTRKRFSLSGWWFVGGGIGCSLALIYASLLRARRRAPVNEKERTAASLASGGVPRCGRACVFFGCESLGEAAFGSWSLEPV